MFTLPVETQIKLNRVRRFISLHGNPCWISRDAVVIESTVLDTRTGKLETELTTVRTIEEARVALNY